MKSAFKIFILVLILGISAALLLSSDIFNIKNIYVTGNKTVPKNEIILLSNIQYNQNIFRLNRKKIIKNILHHPKIKAVRMKRVLPSSIALDIIEREGVALIPYLGSYITIDEESVILEVISLDYNLDLPVIQGITFSDFKLGEELISDNKEKLSIVMNILKYLKSVEMTEMVETINVEDTSNIVINSKSNVLFYLGNNNLDYKIRMAKSILDDLNEKMETGIVDMRHEGSPIFKRD
ncbi:MAG TPA: FtsQ-type POTRA domain-containing protein [Clostridiales bacterium]|nr:FtsQ-type POTRA domain-containing protein [Clostridiales bacterium]